MSVIPASRRNQFKIIPSYIERSRPPWATWKPLSSEKRKGEKKERKKREESGEMRGWKGRSWGKEKLHKFSKKLSPSLPPFFPFLFFLSPSPLPFSCLSLLPSLALSLSPTSRNSTRNGKCMNLQYETHMCLHSQPAIVSKISRFGLERLLRH